MAKFIVVKDIAILDRGVGSENRFIAIDGVNVDNYGALDAQSLQAAKRALSNEAVKMGAKRIHQSNCVDISTGGYEASDDMIVAYNGGDITYTSMQTGFAREKFMISNHLLIPATKFKVTRVLREGRYPGALASDVLNAADEIVRFLPAPSVDEVRSVVDMILEESRVVYFSKEDEEAVLRLLV